MRALLLLVIGALTVFAAPAFATDCSLRQRYSQIEDGALLRFLRCLNSEVTALQRENTELKRRIAALEGIAGDVPAMFTNVDGVVKREAGRVIGRASFTLSARLTGGSSSLPLNQDVLEALCAREGGCALSIGFRAISLFGNDPKAAALSGPCQFVYDAASGGWSVGQGCDGGAATGTDGGSRAGADLATGVVVATSKDACLLTESAPARAIGEVQGFESDHARGMFLVAIPELQPDGIRRFQCELLLN